MMLKRTPLTLLLDSAFLWNDIKNECLCAAFKDKLVK